MNCQDFGFPNDISIIVLKVKIFRILWVFMLLFQNHVGEVIVNDYVAYNDSHQLHNNEEYVTKSDNTVRKIEMNQVYQGARHGY